GPRLLLRALGADEAVLGIREQDVERREAAVGARDVVLQLQAVLVREFRVRVDALLEDAEALADRDDLPEEGLHRHDLLLRPRLTRLHHELTACPALADRARDRLLGVEHGPHRLDDPAEVLVVEGRHQRGSLRPMTLPYGSATAA